MALLGVLAARLPELPQWKNRGDLTELSIEWPADLQERATATSFRGAPVRVRFPSSTTESDDSEPSAPPEAASEATFEGEWVEIACGDITINRWISSSSRNTRSRTRSPRSRNSAKPGRRRDQVSVAPRRAAPRLRAFTLVETVIALALVSTLSVAAVSWSVTAARLARIGGDRANQLEAARAVLRLINDDIHIFDQAIDVRVAAPAARARRVTGSRNNSGTDGQQSRVRTESGALFIETRAHVGNQASTSGEVTATHPTGKATHRYALDPRKSELSLQVNSLPPRILIKGATAFECTLDEETRTLDVSITLEGGAVFSRSYIAP